MKKSLMLAGCFLGASLFCNVNASQQGNPMQDPVQKAIVDQPTIEAFVNDVRLYLAEKQQTGAGEVDNRLVICTATARLANRLNKLGQMSADWAVCLAASIILKASGEDTGLVSIAELVQQAIEITRYDQASGENPILIPIQDEMNYGKLLQQGYLMHIFSEAMQSDLETLSIIHNQSAKFFSDVYNQNSGHYDRTLVENINSLLGKNVGDALSGAYFDRQYYEENHELVDGVNTLYKNHTSKGGDWENERDMIQRLDETLTDIGDALGAKKGTIGNDVDMIRDLFKSNPLSCVSLATKHAMGLQLLDCVASMVPQLDPEAEENTVNMPVLFSLRYGAMNALFENGDLKGTFGTVLSNEASALTTFVEKLYFQENVTDKDRNPEKEENKQVEDYLAKYEKAHQTQDHVGDLTASLFNFYKEGVYVLAASGSDKEAVDNAAKVSLSLANELLWKVFPMEEEQDSQKRATKMAENTVHYLKAAQIFAALGLYLQRTDFLPPPIIEEIPSEKGSDEDIKIDPDQFNEEEDIKIDQNEVDEEEEDS